MRLSGKAMQNDSMSRKVGRSSCVFLVILFLVAGCEKAPKISDPQTRAVSSPITSETVIEQSIPGLSVSDLEAMCASEAAQAVASTLAARVTVEPIKNGFFGGATSFFPAKGEVPAFCQVVGSFETNPETGKTANFMATLPVNWNGKYLQLGCSGHCGQFFVSNPAFPSITVTAQGHASQIIEKGYATFATDEGHTGLASGEWAIKDAGEVDNDAIQDLYFRASNVLADMGKEFTRAFYQAATSKPAIIKRSYFTGCSGGGRDAFVAASYFPEKFDGIIGGSAYDIWGTAFSAAGSTLAAQRSSDAGISPELLALVDPIVKKQCDNLDGVEDGIIQNPAICSFNPEIDLPRCPDNKPGDQCFTQAQIETLSTVINAVTDEHGVVVQPGYSVSEFMPALFPATMKDGAARTGRPQAGMPLWEAALKVFVDKNDPNFDPESIFSFRRGGPGQVTGFHTVVPRAYVDKVFKEGRMAYGYFPENLEKFIKQNRKFLIWHNFGDGNLTPYMSINYYKQLAKLHGGYANLQNNVRLFMLPGTTHCSITSVGPNSFDALTALENWVEKDEAPEALLATVADRQFDPSQPKAEALNYPNWTMPLCKFPEVARYQGQGDIKDAANWRCRADDHSLLKMGERGRQAGVIE